MDLFASLPPGLWSECLQFLPPHDIAIASTSLSKALSEGSGERAAWLALRSAAESGRCGDHHPSLSLDRFRRHPPETWVGLYHVVTELSRGVPGRAIEAALWVLFGQDVVPDAPDYAHANLAAGRLRVLVESGRAGPGCSPLRCVLAAVRLGDAGMWEPAAELLYARPFDGDVDGDVDSCVLICGFIVDRLYAGTYVSADEQDSRDLGEAVVVGRQAVEKLLHSPEVGRDGEMAAGGASVSSTVAPAPPPPQSLFPPGLVRLARARLATARALALLGQHVGLGATDWESIEARPRGRPSRDVHIAELYFREGLELIEASIASLGPPLSSGHSGGSVESLEMCEVRAATIAARGETLYCIASVCVSARIPPLMRESPEDTERDIVERHVRRSVADLKDSFTLIQRRLMEVEGINPRIHEWCFEAPRSLALLQMQTAKDLGKVCDFASTIRRRIGVVADIDESKFFLNFAYSMSLGLNGDCHPTTRNIRELAFRQHQSIPQADIDQWLQLLAY